MEIMAVVVLRREYVNNKLEHEVTIYHNEISVCL